MKHEGSLHFGRANCSSSLEYTWQTKKGHHILVSLDRMTPAICKQIKCGFYFLFFFLKGGERKKKPHTLTVSFSIVDGMKDANVQSGTRKGDTKDIYEKMY